MEALACLILLFAPPPADLQPVPPPAVGTPITPAPPPDPRLVVTSRPSEAAVYAGLTPLGRTPLTVTLPEGEYPLAVSLPGSIPNRRPLHLEPDGYRWGPVIRKVWPPTPWGWPKGAPAWTDDGCRRQRRCGIGAARGFSPALTDTSALARAIVEVARDRQTTVGRLEKTYVESWGHTQATVIRQTTRWRVRPARFDRWQGSDDLVGWRVYGGRGGEGLAWPGLGAGDALSLAGEAALEAQAEIGALASALRWHVAARHGVKVQARQGTFIDGDRERLLFEDEANLMINGAVKQGAVTIHVASRIADMQAIAQKHDIPVGTEYQISDTLELTLVDAEGRLRIGIVAGVPRLLEAAGLGGAQGGPVEAAAALARLQRGLSTVGLSGEVESLGVVNGVPLRRATVGPAGESRLSSL